MTVAAALSVIMVGCASAINKKNAEIHFRAAQQFDAKKDYASAREQYWMALVNARLAGAVASFEPDWVVLAGWMRILTSEFLDRFPGCVVNLHPALPGDLPGTEAIERAWDQAVAGERSESGVMVHLVPDEGVDDGPVLASRVVPVDASGTLEAFAAAVHDTEHQLLVETLAGLCASDRS